MWRCVLGTPDTGRSRAAARYCTPERCDNPPCTARPRLSGEVVNADRPGFPRFAGAQVAIAALDNPADATIVTADSQGEYAVLAAADQRYWVESRATGFWPERHAVAVPERGWDLPLDLRRTASFVPLIPGGQGVTPGRGIVMLEWQGAVSTGAMATLQPPSKGHVFGPDWQPHWGAEIGPNDQAIQVFANVVPGPLHFVLRHPPGATCVVQAGADIPWQVVPEVLTQIDIQCAPNSPAR